MQVDSGGSIPRSTSKGMKDEIESHEPIISVASSLGNM